MSLKSAWILEYHTVQAVFDRLLNTVNIDHKGSWRGGGGGFKQTEAKLSIPAKAEWHLRSSNELPSTGLKSLKQAIIYLLLW